MASDFQNGRFGLAGFDLFVPAADTLPLAEKLTSAIKLVGLEACETARIENAVPRFGIDIDESNLAPEAVGENAISYAKGCYIGQEVIARIRTYGQVAKSLRLLRLPEMHRQLPMKGEKLFNEGKEVGYITSATKSPKLGGNIALAYVRREANAAGSVVQLGSSQGPDCTVISASKP